MLYARAALNRFNQNTGKVVPLLFSESTGKVSRSSLAGIEPAEPISRIRFVTAIKGDIVAALNGRGAIKYR